MFQQTSTHFSTFFFVIEGVGQAMMRFVKLYGYFGCLKIGVRSSIFCSLVFRCFDVLFAQFPLRSFLNLHENMHKYFLCISLHIKVCFFTVLRAYFLILSPSKILNINRFRWIFFLSSVLGKQAMDGLFNRQIVLSTITHSASNDLATLCSYLMITLILCVNY